MLQFAIHNLQFTMNYQFAINDVTASWLIANGKSIANSKLLIANNLEGAAICE